MSGECEKCHEHPVDCKCHADISFGEGIKLQNHPENRMEISEFEFSARTSNCLRDNGIRYVDELTDISIKEILTWRNFGKKSLKEVQTSLGKIGLSLHDGSSISDISKIISHDIPNLFVEMHTQMFEIFKKIQGKLEHVSYVMRKEKKNE